jgi:selenium donor protein
MEYAMGTIRFSTGRETTSEEIEEASSVLLHALYRLRPLADERSESEADTTETDIDKIRLTDYTSGLGCGCKLSPSRLADILKSLPLAQDKNLLVGSETSDDAAVYRLTPDIAVVSTVDFFTPVVDDPFAYGQIAAANAFSDVYAMGGTPLFALNIVAFPSNRLPMLVLHRILQGAQAKADEAGVRVVGGHSIEDNEPKFGMAVTGLVHPDKVLRNVGARPGDDLILTKPIGTGIITTALKRGLVDSKETKAAAIRTMSTLNDKPVTAIREVGSVSALTDVTGFGLLGHLREMAEGSEVDVVVWMDRVPLLRGAFEFAAAGVIPGGTKANLEYMSPVVDWEEGIGAVGKHLLCDAQTSGGLLIAISPDATADLIHRLASLGVECAAHIGRCTEKGIGRIRVAKTELPGHTPPPTALASLLQTIAAPAKQLE